MISHRENNTQRIASLEAAAKELKLKVGMGIADARAMHPSIEILEAEPETDRRLLESIADWCDRYTPLVAIDGADGLFLDITGCAHLFGGERCLLDDLLARLADQGFDARGGLASTTGAAWAAARFRGADIVMPGDETDLAAPLPLSALRLDAAICSGLESVGLRTVGALMAVPRAPLTRRFGKGVVLRLDQLTGAVEEAVSPRLLVPELSVERHFSEPICRMEDVERLIPELAGTLRLDLERRGEGATRLQLLLFRVDGAVSRIAVGTARPLREPAVIAKLFHERLTALQDALDIGYGFDLVRLCALAVLPLTDAQISLAASAPDHDGDTALFADRVRARLGADALRKPLLIESHIPERAVAMLPFAEAPAAGAASLSVLPQPPLPERPLRLFDQPHPVEMISEVEFSFRWHRATYAVTRSEGPERIAPEWWCEPSDAPTRDYFRVEDAEGRRYWLYRERPFRPRDEKPAEPPSAKPRWFLHGLSA